jgi:hypothetical protein
MNSSSKKIIVFIFLSLFLFFLITFKLYLFLIELSHFYYTNCGFGRLNKLIKDFFLFNFFFSISSFNIRLIEN